MKKKKKSERMKFDQFKAAYYSIPELRLAILSMAQSSFQLLVIPEQPEHLAVTDARPKFSVSAVSSAKKSFNRSNQSLNIAVKIQDQPEQHVNM
jgi:hypothetical protein